MTRTSRIAPALVGSGLALLGGQLAYVIKRDLPTFGNMDASIELGNPSNPPLDITAFGDSSLTGPGLDSPDDIWIRRAIKDYENCRHVRLTSLAVGGSQATDVLEEQLPLFTGADVAIIAVGSNDALRGTPLSRIERALIAIIEELISGDTVVALTGVGDLGTIPRLPSPLADIARYRGRQVDAIEARLAAGNPRVFKAPIWPRTVTTFRATPDVFAGDLFHANADGHRIWADAFRSTLRHAVALADHRRQ
ncbi:MAG: GDSL-type esterase/lipase family protein [Acidimicrobiia bacterium]|nr:GDSL-type esterase/lipase family protein [Acidimicrobiia bacterium]